MRRIWIGWAAVAALAAGCQPAPAPEAPPAGGGGEFAALVAEVLEPHCAGTGCHSGDRPAGGLHLGDERAYSDLVDAPAHRRPDRKRVVPGDPDSSYLVNRIVDGGDTPRMPLGADPLERADIDRIREWIRQGAKR